MSIAACNQPLVNQRQAKNTEITMAGKSDDNIEIATQAGIIPTPVSSASPTSAVPTISQTVTNTAMIETIPVVKPVATSTSPTQLIKVNPEISGSVLVFYSVSNYIPRVQDAYRVLPGDEAVEVFLSGKIRDMAVSPNGNQLSYVLHDDQGDHLILRDLTDQTESVLFQRPQIISGLVWAPNGDELAFIQQQDISVSGEIRIINRDGQDERSVAEGYAPVWSPDGQFLAYTTPQDDLSKDLTNRIEVTDRLGQKHRVVLGTTQQLNQLDFPTAVPHPHFPQTDNYYAFSVDWSLDGKTILFALNGNKGNLYQLELDSGEITDLMIPDGVIFAGQFIDGTNQSLAYWYEGQDWHPLELVTLLGDGRVQRRILNNDTERPESYACYTISPDQRFVAYVATTPINPPLFDLVVYSLQEDREVLRRDLFGKIPEKQWALCNMVWLP